MKTQICAGAGVALVLPEGAQSIKDALHTVRYTVPQGGFANAGILSSVGVANKERAETEALHMARKWAEGRGYDVEEIPCAPW